MKFETSPFLYRLNYLIKHRACTSIIFAFLRFKITKLFFNILRSKEKKKFKAMIKKKLVTHDFFSINAFDWKKNLKTALDKMKKHIKVGSCQKLPYKNEYFDFVISISTIHNLSPSKLHLAIREIERVKKNTGKSFIRVKGFKTFKEKKFIEDWNVVAKSNVSIKRWLKILMRLKNL